MYSIIFKTYNIAVLMWDNICLEKISTYRMYFSYRSFMMVKYALLIQISPTILSQNGAVFDKEFSCVFWGGHLIFVFEFGDFIFEPKQNPQTSKMATERENPWKKGYGH